ncbi:MAG: alpha/beta hydrolase [Acidobacteriota bacterium]
MTRFAGSSPGWSWRLICFVAAASVLLSGCSMRQIIYPAPAILVGPPPAGMEEITLEMRRGATVVAWYRAGGLQNPGRPALLFFHGNGENLETMRRSGSLTELDGLDVPYLVVDYPGYGRSSGTPTEASVKEAGETALQWLVRRYPDRPRVVCGWSLGAAVAVYVAAGSEEVQGLIALSAWTSLADVAALHFPSWLTGFLLRESYDSAELAAGIDLPTLVIHGSRDEIIPAAQGRALSEAMPQADWLDIDAAGHNDLLSREQVWRAIVRFLNLVEADAAV